MGSGIIKLTVHQFTFNINFSPEPGRENHENAKHVASHLELTQKGSDSEIQTLLASGGDLCGEDHSPQRKTAGE